MYLLIIYYVLGTVPGPKDVIVNKRVKKNLCSHCISILVGGDIQ